ncbi:hypothetical protein [Umezawaea sp. Da 62-37]|nr:hypothetical protein [Umezawaea sp. Da 62-37]WNV84917.1 hypothetical protein RM788_43300 [Umezawaea sp. Da 62-37]
MVTWTAQALAAALLRDNSPDVIERARRVFPEVAGEVVHAEGGIPLA